MFTDAALSTMLGMASVAIATADAGTSQGTDQDINIDGAASLTWSTGNTLTLNARRNINLGGTFTAGSGTLALMFGGTLAFGGVSLSVGTVTAAGVATGTQTIQGPDAATTWTLTGGGAGSVVSGGWTVSFSAIENLEGGSMVDTFAVTGAHTGDLSGGGGDDTFDLDAVVTGTLAGGAGTDTLMGRDAAVTWVVSGANSGTYDGQTFTNVENLEGGSMVDTFTVTGAHTGDLSGGGGDDTFDLDAVVTGTLAGGAGTDTLMGRDAAVTWVVSGMESGTYDGQTFTNVENLEGGSMVDTFAVTGAHTGDLSGGGGADAFMLGGAVTGTVSGGAGDDAFTLESGGSATGLDGGTDTDTLTGDDGNATWSVTDNNRGTYLQFISPMVMRIQQFTDIENLVGGSNAGRFCHRCEWAGEWQHRRGWWDQSPELQQCDHGGGGGAG